MAVFLAALVATCTVLMCFLMLMACEMSDNPEAGPTPGMTGIVFIVGMGAAALLFASHFAGW